MVFSLSIYSLPKRGLEAQENQDAYWPRLTTRSQYLPESNRDSCSLPLVAAVADGATEGILSEIWARIVVARSFQLFPANDIEQLAATSGAAWRRYKQFKTRSGKSLTHLPAWLEEPSLAQGAFSTVAAIKFETDTTFKAVAVGDSCIFHVRENKLLHGWPLNTSSDFANRPYLIASEQTTETILRERVQSYVGTYTVGDTFFLMTDALSCWFLTRFEKGEKPWQPLSTVDQGGSFEALIRDWREKGEMKNDDVTLIRVDVR